MNFLIFIFSYIDIQPEYNLLSFILSAQSKLNIGRLSNINNISIRVKTSRNQAGWSGLVGRLVLGKIVSLSFQWPGEPHSQAGNVCFAWKVRSLSWADLLVRVWRSAGFYCILTCNDGVMGRWDQPAIILYLTWSIRDSDSRIIIFISSSLALSHTSNVLRPPEFFCISPNLLSDQS